MTAQITDTVKYREREYEILAVENKFPFDPREHGFNPTMMHTACYRGYFCLYVIKEGKLSLAQLTIHQEEEYPSWQDIKPGPQTPNGRIYRGLERPIEYTGGLILGRGLIHEFYQHMGYQRPHCFKEVLEFRFNNGKLEKMKDKSQKAKELRMIIREKKHSRKEITRYIRDAFSLSYEEKGI